MTFLTVLFFFRFWKGFVAALHGKYELLLLIRKQGNVLFVIFSNILI